MRTRILLYSIIVILVSVAVTSLVSVQATVNNYLDQKRVEMADIGLLLCDELVMTRDLGGTRTFDEFAGHYFAVTGFRVTLIGADGEVLADSRSRENIIYMENHAEREEVVAALADGSGSSQRKSESFGGIYIYEAIRQEFSDGEIIVVRLSMEVDRAKIASEHAGQVAGFSALIGILLGVGLAVLFTRQLMRPIREMERHLAETLELNKTAENIRKEFVANVTHELKTPLTSISGFAETLQGGAGDKPEVRARFLEIISLETARLSRLIDDTLVISDIESGRDHMAPGGVINVKKAINDVLGTLRPQADGKDIEVFFEAQYEIHIGGDEGRFKQLVVNLAENAIKYSERGKRVYIRAFKEADGSVCITVRDEGIGISEADLPHVFERFYRVDASRSRESGGTGLGLAIVKHIAGLFGATLDVESELGVGSTFTIRFPEG